MRDDPGHKRAHTAIAALAVAFAMLGYPLNLPGATEFFTVPAGDFTYGASWMSGSAPTNGGDLACITNGGNAYLTNGESLVGLDTLALTNTRAGSFTMRNGSSAGTVLSVSNIVIGDCGSTNSVCNLQGGMFVQSGSSGIASIGRTAGSRGTLNISGTVTSVFEAATFCVGGAGTGSTMVVTNGARVSSSGGWIGSSPGANGNSVTVSGGGSIWDLGGGVLSVGCAGSTGNVLTVRNSGLLTNLQSLVISSSNRVNIYGGTVTVDHVVMQTNAEVGFSMSSPGRMIAAGDVTLNGFIYVTNLPVKGVTTALVMTCVGTIDGGGLTVGALPAGYTGRIRIDTNVSPKELILQLDGSSLAGYWKFDEGAGTNAFDVSVNNSTGTLMGTGGNLPQWIAGHSGLPGDSALSFDGSKTMYVKIPDLAPLHIARTGCNSFTIGMWFYDKSSYYGVMFSYYNGTRNIFHQTSNYSSDYHSYLWSDRNTNFRMTDGMWSWNAWHYLAITYDNSTIRVYVDNMSTPLAAKGAANQTLDQWGELFIGACYPGTYQWNGYLDDVVIFDNVVTNLQALKDGNHPAMLRYWTGGGYGPNLYWTDASNWGGAQHGAGKTLEFDTSNGLDTNWNDFEAGTRFAGITFRPAAGSFILRGSAISVNGDVVNNSPASQSIALTSLVLDGARNFLFNAASGALIISNPVTEATGQTNGLVKTGTNTLTLAGACSYTGPTLVSNGMLRLAGPDGALAGTTVTVSGANSTLAGNGSVGGPVAVVENARLAPGPDESTPGVLLMESDLLLDSATLEVKCGAAGSAGASNDIITVAGDLTVTNNCSLEILQLSGFEYGTYDIIAYTGILRWSGSILPPAGSAQYGYRILTNTAGMIQLKVFLPASVKTWDGQVDGNWDIGATANWKTNDVPAMYHETDDGNDPVVFDDTAKGTTLITLDATVAPYSILFTNNVLRYRISGTGGVSGATELLVGGTGGVTLSTSNSFSGDTVLGAGTLTLGDPGALAGSTLNYDNFGGVVSFGTLTNATLGGLRGGQNLDLANTSAAPVVITVGGNGQPTTYGGVLSGPGGLTKTGSAALLLSSDATYTGCTIVDGGLLGATTLSGTTSIEVGGTVNIESYMAMAPLTVSPGGIAVISSPGLSLAAVTNAGSVTFEASTGSITLGGLAGSGTTTFNAAAVVPMATDGTVCFNGAAAAVGVLGDSAVCISPLGCVLTVGCGTQTCGVVSGAGQLVKSSSGALVLNGSNTFSGGTTLLSGGLLSINALSDTPGVPSALGHSGTISVGNGTFRYTGTNAVSTARWYTTGGSSVFDISETGGSFEISAWYGSQDVVKTGAGTLIFSGVVYWVGPNEGLNNVQVDAGTLVLAANVNDFNVATTAINITDVKPGGTLRIGHASPQIAYRAGTWHPAGSLHMSGGTLDMNSYSMQLPLLDGSGTIINSASGTTAVVQWHMSGHKLFSGNIEDRPGIVAINLLSTTGGPWTWSLAGTNSYSGPTTINAGNLTAESSGALSPNSAYTIYPGRTVALQGYDNSIGSLTGPGSVTLGGATLTVGADNTSPLPFTGAITGSGGLTKTGNGTLNLTGPNTYDGDTRVEGGVLSISQAYLSPGADVYMTSGATLALAFAGTNSIRWLYFDGRPQLQGVWGAVSSDAEYKSTFITGTGKVLVTKGPDLHGTAVIVR